MNIGELAIGRGIIRERGSMRRAFSTLFRHYAVGLGKEVIIVEETLDRVMDWVRIFGDNGRNPRVRSLNPGQKYTIDDGKIVRHGLDDDTIHPHRR